MFDYVSGCAVAVNSRRFRWVCLAFSFAFARDHIGQIDCPYLEKLIERRGEAASITPPRQTDTIVSAECKPAQIGKENLGVAYLWGSGVSKNPDVGALLL